MADVLTKEQRRLNMQRIRSRDTKPELVLRNALWRKGLRYRKSARVYGRPDIIFLRVKTAIFVDGCFWHGCPSHLTWPSTNQRFWREKLEKNKSRDNIVNAKLKEDGWCVIRVWEHDIDEELIETVAMIESMVRARIGSLAAKE